MTESLTRSQRMQYEYIGRAVSKWMFGCGRYFDNSLLGKIRRGLPDEERNRVHDLQIVEQVNDYLLLQMLNGDEE